MPADARGGGEGREAGGGGAERPIGSLAIVLHSHMPYVEGFGTYPFGEEWLFDAIVRSYLPLAAVADRLTIGVTPVLADQLEAPGLAPRLREFVARQRLEACEADAAELEAPLARACATEAERYRAGLARLNELGDDLLAIFREPAERGAVELIASCATHAVLPMLASVPGRRLQIDAGLRSHRRRFGASRGFWLPECAYEPGIERLLAERGQRFFCVDQSAREPALDALAPVATAAGPVAAPIDWEAISWVWGRGGYPAHPVHADLHRRAPRGARAWSIGGEPYDPEAARRLAGEQAAAFAAAAAERLARFRELRGRPGLLTFAVDTELLGDWWWEGPVWLEELLRVAPGHGLELLTLSEAIDRHPAEERPLGRSSWGEGKDMRTWDSPAVADLAFAARRLEIRLMAALSGGAIEGDRARRAIRELLAVQSSDWAFIDARGEAGDYGFERATAHAHALHEALRSPASPDPRLRALAPDLRLAPLLEP